jgi:hypothetical protein
MKRRSVWAAGAILVVSVLLANLIPETGASAADWRDPKLVTASRGLQARHPRAWHGFTLGPAAAESLVISSFPISQDWPSREDKSVPDGGIYIWVFTYGPLSKSLRISDEFPTRPGRFELAGRDHGFYECGFGLEGYAVRFRERGLAVQAMVALGRGARREDATAVLKSLSIWPGLRPSVAET